MSWNTLTEWRAVSLPCNSSKPTVGNAENLMCGAPFAACGLHAECDLGGGGAAVPAGVDPKSETVKIRTVSRGKERKKRRRGYWNNQAPERGVRLCDPPALATPRRHGHNRSERNQATPRKMAALPAAMPCATSRDRPRWLRGAPAANFRGRGSR